MSTRRPAHADRRRADSFGLAADDYHRYRPRYPQSLIDDLLGSSQLRVLDVGAGTGIASAQLMQAGAEVVPLEGGIGVADAIWPDVRDAIAVCIGRVRAWVPGEIGAHAVGSREARPLADQNNNAVGPKGLRDRITNRHAPLTNNDERTDPPALGAKRKQRENQCRPRDRRRAFRHRRRGGRGRGRRRECWRVLRGLWLRRRFALRLGFQTLQLVFRANNPRKHLVGVDFLHSLHDAQRDIVAAAGFANVTKSRMQLGFDRLAAGAAHLMQNPAQLLVKSLVTGE